MKKSIAFLTTFGILGAAAPAAQAITGVAFAPAAICAARAAKGEFGKTAVATQNSRAPDAAKAGSATVRSNSNSVGMLWVAGTVNGMAAVQNDAASALATSKMLAEFYPKMADTDTCKWWVADGARLWLRDSKKLLDAAEALVGAARKAGQGTK